MPRYPDPRHELLGPDLDWSRTGDGVPGHGPLPSGKPGPAGAIALAFGWTGGGPLDGGGYNDLLYGGALIVQVNQVAVVYTVVLDAALRPLFALEDHDDAAGGILFA
ncbi:MAG: hypothetical protein R3F55_03070 [Alphaproteobacteria bacterium]